MLSFLTVASSLTVALKTAEQNAEGNDAARQLKQRRIPSTLILTGAVPSMDKLGGSVQRNINRTLESSPGLTVRWFDDASCARFIEDHYDSELLSMFEHELRGSFRGDICRTSVLAQDGGYYTDLDVAVREPLYNLVDENTTFMSVREGMDSQHGVLNALIAAEPGSEVMKEALAQMRDWYNNRVTKDGWMGPSTLGRAVEAVVARGCPDHNAHLDQHAALFESGRSPLKTDALQWHCGEKNNLRLYTQDRLQCFPRDSLTVQAECSENRAKSTFDGLLYGIFEPGPGRKIVAWPRFEDCDEFGCGGGGWTEKPPELVGV